MRDCKHKPPAYIKFNSFFDIAMYFDLKYYNFVLFMFIFYVTGKLIFALHCM